MGKTAEKERLAADMAQEVWNRLLAPDKNGKGGYSFNMLKNCILKKLEEQKP